MTYPFAQVAQRNRGGIDQSDPVSFLYDVPNFPVTEARRLSLGATPSAEPRSGARLRADPFKRFCAWVYRFRSPYGRLDVAEMSASRKRDLGFLDGRGPRCPERAFRDGRSG